MRALCIVMAFAVGGCSLLFDGKDLKGRGGGGDDMGAGGGDGDGGTDDLGGGGGGDGGGGGGGACTPTSGVTFTVLQPSVAATGPYEIALGDLNKDGKLDIVSANYNSNNFSVLLGVGDGRFSLAATAPFAACDTPQYVAVRDLDNDGLDDVLISCYNGSASPSATSAVEVYLNTSSGTTISFAAAKPVSLAVADLYYPVFGKFDADGNADLALVGNSKLYLFSGDGHGAFTPSTPLTAGMTPSYAAAGNLNGDAVDDLVVYNYDSDDMTMYLSKPTGGYAATTLAHAASGTLYYAGRPVLVDITKDGLVDIVVTSATTTPGTLQIFKNSGSATAPAFPSTGTEIDTGDSPLANGVADFNCDGTLDVAVSTNGCTYPDNLSCTNDTSSPPVVWILPGHGTGFDAALTTGIPSGTESVLVGDFNRDGYPDIATGSSGTTVTILLNTPQ